MAGVNGSRCGDSRQAFETFLPLRGRVASRGNGYGAKFNADQRRAMRARKRRRGGGGVNPAHGFDVIAASYDRLWTDSPVGRLQREAFWRHAGGYLKNARN